MALPVRWTAGSQGWLPSLPILRCVLSSSLPARGLGASMVSRVCCVKELRKRTKSLGRLCWDPPGMPAAIGAAPSVLAGNITQRGKSRLRTRCAGGHRGALAGARLCAGQGVRDRDAGGHWRPAGWLARRPGGGDAAGAIRSHLQYAHNITCFVLRGSCRGSRWACWQRVGCALSCSESIPRLRCWRPAWQHDAAQRRRDTCLRCTQSLHLSNLGQIWRKKVQLCSLGLAGWKASRCLVRVTP